MKYTKISYKFLISLSDLIHLLNDEVVRALIYSEWPIAHAQTKTTPRLLQKILYSFTLNSI